MKPEPLTRKPRPALLEAVVWAGAERLAASLHASPDGFHYIFYRSRVGTLRSGPAAVDPEVAARIHEWLADEYDSDEVLDALDRWYVNEVQPLVNRV
jgi:hypothetical protein